MNTETLNHLLALQAHHQKALAAVADLIKLHVGETKERPPTKEAYVMPSAVQVGTILNRSENYSNEGCSVRAMKVNDVVLETLAVLEQDRFTTVDVLRAIKAKYPSEYLRRHPTSFSQTLTRMADKGLIRIETNGSGRRPTTYSK